MAIRAVIDTNVIFSGLRSRNGQSFRLLELLIEDRFEIAISVPLILEYEAVLKKHLDKTIFSDGEISDFINYLCKIGIPTQIYYLWRPILSDPLDDHVLEVAVASESQFIITYNERDFYEATKFGLTILKPVDFITRPGGK